MFEQFRRLKRVAQSYLPHLSSEANREYSYEDARMMLTDLGLQMSPEVLDTLLSRLDVLDDFILSIYQLEKEIKRTDIVTEFCTIDMKYEPHVYADSRFIGFTITHEDEEILFAEYKGDIG